MSRSISYKGVRSLQPGVPVEQNWLKDELIPVGIKPFERGRDTPSPEQVVKAAECCLEWVRQELNDKFIGRRSTEKNQHAQKRLVQQAMHQLEQANALPFGVKIENIRIENDDTLRADVTLPYIPGHVDIMATLDAPETNVVTFRSNLTRPGAPWSYEE